MVFIRKHYGERLAIRKAFEGVSRSIQSAKAECDVNFIVAKYRDTGLVSHLAKTPGAFMNLPDDHDYQEAMNVVISARGAFEALPAAIRTRFDNDPALFLAFATDEANSEEMEKLGLRPRTRRDGKPAAEPAPAAEPPEGA